MSSSSTDDFSASNRGAFAPLLVGAAYAAVALARQTKVVSWLRGFLSVPREYERPDPIRRRLDAGWSLPRLRDAIVGRRKPVLLARYGIPRSAALNDLILTGPDAKSAAFRADTWYYVLDAQQRTAMSIRFTRGLASEVEFFDAP